MPAHRSENADIEAAIAKGEWWSRLFDELADLGMERVGALSVTGPGPGQQPLRGVVQTALRVFRAVRQAVVAAMGLDQILAGLADLRARSAADIAAARARARAKMGEDAAARERAEERSVARREARDAATRQAENHQKEDDGAPRAKPEPRDRDPLVEALDKRLAAVDPAIVDFDDLGLRETVLRICADLGVAPDWGRWEAGRWATPDTPPKTAARVQAPPRWPVTPPRKVLPPSVLPGLPRPAPRAADTALSRALLGGQEAARWRTPRLE